MDSFLTFSQTSRPAVLGDYGAAWRRRTPATSGARRCRSAHSFSAMTAPGRSTLPQTRVRKVWVLSQNCPRGRASRSFFFHTVDGIVRAWLKESRTILRTHLPVSKPFSAVNRLTAQETQKTVPKRLRAEQTDGNWDGSDIRPLFTIRVVLFYLYLFKSFISYRNEWFWPTISDGYYFVVWTKRERFQYWFPIPTHSTYYARTTIKIII